MEQDFGVDQSERGLIHEYSQNYQRTFYGPLAYKWQTIFEDVSLQS